jgi:nitrous oxidase accessory protein NosD
MKTQLTHPNSKLLVFFAVSIFLLANLSTHATQRFVNDNSLTGDLFTSAVGSNANPGTSGSPYLTVTFAIGASSSGDTIYVDAGTFNEDIVINKSVNVFGLAATSTILKGIYAGSANAILISASNVVLRDVTVTRDYGANLAAWNASGKNQGINIGASGTGAILENIVLTGNRNALFINNAQNVSVTGCTIENNRTGVHYANNINGAVLSNNFIRNNFTMGVLFNFDLGVLSAVNASMDDNNISGNWYGQISFQRGTGAPSNVGNLTGLTMSCNWLGSVGPNATASPTGEPGYTTQVPTQFGGTDPGLNRSLYGQEAALIPYTPWLIGSVDGNIGTEGFQPSAACTGNSCGATFDFSSAVSLASTQTGGSWYTDRYAPSGFFAPETFAGGSRLKQSINASDCQTCRPGAYTTAFYNTQGRKFDLPSGTIGTSIELYVPAAWATSGRRMAGFWGTAFDVSNNVSGFPIIEFTSDGANPRFRGYESGTGLYIDMGLPAGFTYDNWVTLNIEVLPSGEFRYSVNDLVAETTSNSPTASVDIANTILQGHNTLTGVTYDIYWDNFSYTSMYVNAVASGLLTCGTGTVNINVSAVGGTSPYIGTGTFSVGAGSYSYTVTDANGCTDNTSITIAPALAHSGPKWYVNDNSQSGDIFTSVVGNAGNSGTASCPFLTIAQAVAAASVGDTIYIDAGTFTENVVLNKSLTVIGSGPGSTTITPSVACTGDGIQISASNVNVSDLKVTGFNYGVRTSASTISLYNVESLSNCQYGLNTGNGTNGLSMIKCKFNNNNVGGWRAGTADNVSNVLMDSSEVKSNGTTANGFGTFIAAGTPAANTFDYITIKNSDFSNNLEKGMYFEKLRHALIDNVIIDNSGVDPNYGFNNGIDINLKYDSYTDITIQNSTITNCGSMGTAVALNNPSALAIKARDDSPAYNSDPASLSGFVMTNNYISGPVNGLRFGEFNKVNATPTGITVTENHFGNSYTNKAVLNTTSNTGISISCNWYGTSAGGSVIALHSSIASFTPFLIGGSDLSVAPGFQPAASCSGTPCSVADNFNSAVVLSPTPATGKWYVDRYAPAGFNSPEVFGGDSRLKQSINAADCQTCRPPSFSSAFYNTQGRKYDLPSGTLSMSIDLYIPSAWASTGNRMAGFWATAFDISDAVSAFPIIEFTSDGANPRFRGYESGTGVYVDMGLPSGFTYDNWVTLKIEVLPGGEFRYSVNSLQMTTTTNTGAGSVDLANTILQGHNTSSGVTYDIYWDNYIYSPLYAEAVVTGTLTCSTGSVSVAVTAVGGYAPYIGEGTFSAGAGSHTYTITDTYGCTASTTITVAAAPGHSGTKWYVNDNNLSGDVFTTAVGNAGNSGTNACPFLTIGQAVTAAAIGDTIYVDAGTYNEDVAVNKQLKIFGAGSSVSTVSGPIGGGSSTFQVSSSNVIIDGFTITRAGNNTTDWNNAGLNSAGIAIQSQGIFAEVRFCEITGMRTGIDVNNSNGNNIHNNNIHFNRTGLIFRNQTDNTTLTNNFISDNWTVGVLFLDASSGTNVPVQSAINSNFNNNDISGNWYGQIVDRQTGGSLPAAGSNLKNFSCNWYGVIPPVVSTANSAEPGYAAQIPVAYGGSAVAPGGQPDILGSASANFVYTPYLTGGTDLGGNANDGFQPAAACSAPCALIVSTSSTNTTCPSNNNGTASVTISSGGVSPYTYLWSNAATTSTISGLSAGTFTVTVTDVNGCTASSSVSVTASLAGPVHNLNTGLNYCTIQSAINAVTTLNGHTITVDPGTYNEQVLVNKSLTIQASSTQPTIDFTGVVSGKPTLFDISANNVTIDNIHFNVDLSKLKSAIIASAAAIDNIIIQNNIIDAYGTPAAGTYSDRNAVSINYTGNANYRVATGGVNSITFTNNTVNGTLPQSFFRSGVVADEAGGTFSGNTLQSINHDVLVRFGNNGNISITGNNLNGGGVELDDMNAGAGILTVSNNIFDATFANSSAPGTAVLRLQNNYNSKVTNISGNTFSNHQWAISSANYNSLTIDNNTFTPLSGSTTYHHLAINNKSISTNSNIIVQVALGATVTNNTFNGSGTVGGTALSFHNHDNDNASYGAFVIGGVGNENDFNTDISNVIYLDHQSGTSSGSIFPGYTSLIGAGAGALTTMGLWSVNIDATNNNFDVGSGLQLPSAMSLANLFSLEDRIQHSIDAGGLGFVRVKANNDYVTVNSFASPLTTSAKIQRGVDAASNGHTVNVGPGSFNDNVLVNKEVNISGQGQGITNVYPATSNPNCGGAGGGSICAGGSNIFLVQANNVTIHDMTIDGDNTSLTSGTIAGGADLDARTGIITDHTLGVYQNLEVYNTTVQNIYLRGIYASTGGSYNFHDNTINNVQANAASIGMFNFGGAGAMTNNIVSNCNDAIASNWSTGTIFSGNTVSNSGSGIHSDNNGGSGGIADIITNNLVQNSNLNGYGIWVFAPYRAVQVTNNTINNVDVGLTAAGQNAAVTTTFSGNVVDGQNKVNSTGMYVTTSLFGFGSSDVSVDFNNNYVVNNAGDGFYLESQASQTLTLNAHNNSITSNSPYNVEKGVGAAGAGTFTIDMTCNWWGSTSPATVAAGMSGSFSYIPYLNDGTDNNINIGFQPLAVCSAPCALTVSGSTTDATCPSNNNGTASVSVSGGGISPYTYSWSNGATTSTASGLSAGNYTVVVTDVNGCTASVTVTVSNSLAGPVHNTNTGLNYCTIQSAISAVATLNGHSITVDAGTYNEDVTVNKQLTITGAGIGSSIVSGPIGGGGSTFQIASSNVVIDGFTITRAGNNTTDWNNAGLNIAGVAVQGLTASVEVRYCEITGMRTGIDVNNSNGNNIHNNNIHFNRTGLIFRNQTDNTTLTNNFISDNWTVGVLFLDASSGTNVPVQSAINSNFNNNDISGNWYGQIVDRQTGGSLPAAGSNLKNFSCNWYGVIPPVVSTANSAEPGYAAQIPVAYGGSAVAPGGQPDILGSASANFVYAPYLTGGTDLGGNANDGFQPAAACSAPCALIASSASTAIACNGGSATVTVSASGGTGSYTGTGTFTVTAGTYTYTVNDINGCSATTTITVTEPTALIASSSQGASILCFGGTTTVTVSATGGTSPYSGLGTFTVSAGTHTYTVTDANGCTTSTTITVSEPSQLLANYSASPILCYGGYTVVTISGSGGTAPYTGTGPANQYVGTTVYTISDVSGCTASVSVTLTQPMKVEGTTTTVGTTCAGNDGSASITATGGTGVYTYLWTGGQTTQTATGLSAGTYTVTITDGNGCTGSASATVANGGSTPATPGSISGPTGACRNQTGIVYSIASVPGATSYIWTLPTGATGSSTTNSITLAFGPSYNGGFICVSASNVCGTSLQSCLNIPVLTIRPSQPTPISGPSIICGGSIGTYSATSINAQSYFWKVTGSGVSIISGQGTSTVQVNIPIGFGQGSIQVTGVNCVGNSVVRGITLTGIPSHSNAVVGPNYICANNTATYTMPLVNGATTYQWTSTGDISLITSSQNSLNSVAQFNFGPAFTSGTITITVSNTCGSYARSFVVRSAPDQPGGMSGPSTALCGVSGVTYSIGAVATATSYTWTTSNPDIAIQSIAPNGLSVVVNFLPGFTSAGNICVTANNGCGASTQRCFTISARPATPILSGPTSVCKSQSAVGYSIPAIPSATSYTWSVTGGALLTPSGTSASINYTSATSSSAIVRVNAINACGASQPGTAIVNVNLFCRTAADESVSLLNGEVNVYPNPSSGIVTVEFTSDEKSKVLLTITDLTGKIIMNEIINSIPGNNSKVLELENLAKGIYILNLKSDLTISKSIRLVIE